MVRPSRLAPFHELAFFADAAAGRLRPVSKGRCELGIGYVVSVTHACSR